MWYIHNGILAKRNEILSFVATCMDSENSLLNEVTQRKTNYLSLIHEFLKKIYMIQMNLFMKQIHRHRKQTYGYQRGKLGGGRRDRLRVWDW